MGIQWVLGRWLVVRAVVLTGPLDRVVQALALEAMQVPEEPPAQEKAGG